MKLPIFLSVALSFGAAIAAPVSDVPTSIDRRQLFSGLFGSSIECGPVAVIYCKGTIEPGDYGIVVGNQFTGALQAVLPRNTQFSAVDYSNTIGGYLIGGSRSGVREMQRIANEYVQKCPTIKLVLSGYR